MLRVPNMKASVRSSPSPLGAPQKTRHSSGVRQTSASDDLERRSSCGSQSHSASGGHGRLDPTDRQPCHAHKGEAKVPDELDDEKLFSGCDDHIGCS